MGAAKRLHFSPYITVLNIILKIIKTFYLFLLLLHFYHKYKISICYLQIKILDKILSYVIIITPNELNIVVNRRSFFFKRISILLFRHTHRKNPFGKNATPFGGMAMLILTIKFVWRQLGVSHF